LTSLRSILGLKNLSAILRRDFAVRRSYRAYLWFDLIFGVINVGVYFFISQTFGESASKNIDDAPNYFAFVVVGITITLVIQASTTEMVRALRQEQLTGTLEALLVQPVKPRELSVGFVLLPVGHAMSRAAVYLLILVFVSHVNVADATWAGFTGILVATGLAMLSIGIGGCALTLLVKHGEVLVGMLILGMGLLGGALFPVDVLPNQLDVLSQLVPTRYAFDGARAAVYGGSGLGGDFLALAAFSVITLPISLLLFQRALAAARRAGSLNQY
jgi:ABC-2 type transport system permease protein